MGLSNPEEYGLCRGSQWLSAYDIIRADTEMLQLKKKFFFSDANVDKSDPVQLHLLVIFFSSFSNIVFSNNLNNSMKHINRS